MGKLSIAEKRLIQKEKIRIKRDKREGKRNYMREFQRAKRKETLMRMTLEELQLRCMQANLPYVGTKASLVEGLQAKEWERKKKRGIRIFDNAEEFSPDDTQLPEQVAPLNMTEHQ